MVSVAPHHAGGVSIWISYVGDKEDGEDGKREKQDDQEGHVGCPARPAKIHELFATADDAKLGVICAAVRLTLN